MKLLFVPVLGLLLQAAPQAPAALRFSWPTDLAARVETEKTRERHTGGPPTSNTLRIAYRMRALPHAEGLQIQYDEFRMKDVAPTEAAGVAEVLTAFVPNLIVDSGGHFVGVKDLASLRDAMSTMLAPAQKAAGDLPAGMKELLSKLTSEEVLTSLAGQEWQVLVGAWHDAPLTNERYEAETSEVSPIWPDLKIPLKVTSGMVEKGSCVRGAAKIDCAVFELRSAVDQSAMAAVMKRVFDGAKDMGGMALERIDVVTVVRVRLETLTMVPHELSSTKTVEMIVNTGRERREVKQIDRRTSRFVY